MVASIIVTAIMILINRCGPQAGVWGLKLRPREDLVSRLPCLSRGGPERDFTNRPLTGRVLELGVQSLICPQQVGNLRRAIPSVGFWVSALPWPGGGWGGGAEEFSESLAEKSF